MSDSFADLWNISAPSKPQTLGSISTSARSSPAPTSLPPTGNNTYRRPDAFSMLSSTGSSMPTTRTTTPKSNGSSPRPTQPSRGSEDAFSDLFAGSSAKYTANMTIAERTAIADREKRQAATNNQTMQPALSSAWAGLDSLGGSSFTPSATSNGSARAVIDDDWGLGDFASAPAAAKPSATPAAKPAPAVVEDDWGLGDFGSVPAAPAPSKKAPVDDGWGEPVTRSKNLWDMDDLVGSDSRVDTPSRDFDFGTRENALLGGDDQDDILGDLAKPAERIRRPSPQPQTHSQPQARPSSRTVSPPPHILGRIVEMGFSIQQARVALASTDTGLDVDTAIEILLANNAGDEPSRHSPPPMPRRRTISNNQSPPVRRREAARRSSPQGEDNGETGLQTDKLVAQATSLGLSFFNKANAAWKEGKDRVQKAYAERVAEQAEASRESNRTPNSNGRPKWMQETVADEEETAQENHNSVIFSDDGDGPQPHHVDSRPKAQKRPEPPRQQSPPVADLLSAVASGSNQPYRSPFRRGKPAAAAAAAAPAVVAPRRPTPPPAKPLRTLVITSPSAISTSKSHKDVGADKFKLGQYGDAEAAYSRAIECLPAGHLLLIPLYNNRALVRLKTGDYTGAAEDTGVVIELVDEPTWRDEQKRTKSVEQGAGVDLGDSLVKAWKRRAEALEGREKWDDARQDWERVAGSGWAPTGVRGEGVRGAGRCRQALRAGTEPPKPKPKPAPQRPPARRGPTPPSQAVETLKKANDAAAAEDDMKYQLKDAVDAKLLAWKGGKETNIRALIASLDTVLWPELGLQKTSIAELVTPGQVKIRYTKAIAKLHPDKLNPNNSTTEQRMIANGVFGTLNEAWNAFKQ